MNFLPPSDMGQSKITGFRKSRSPKIAPPSSPTKSCLRSHVTTTTTKTILLNRKQVHFASPSFTRSPVFIYDAQEVFYEEETIWLAGGKYCDVFELEAKNKIQRNNEAILLQEKWACSLDSESGCAPHFRAVRRCIDGHDGRNRDRDVLLKKEERELMMERKDGLYLPPSREGKWSYEAMEIQAVSGGHQRRKGRLWKGNRWCCYKETAWGRFIEWWRGTVGRTHENMYKWAGKRRWTRRVWIWGRNLGKPFGRKGRIDLEVKSAEEKVGLLMRAPSIQRSTV